MIGILSPIEHYLFVGHHLSRFKICQHSEFFDCIVRVCMNRGGCGWACVWMGIGG